MSTVSYALLRAADPVQWRTTASLWRAWAALAGHWVAEVRGQAGRLTTVWSGTAGSAAAARLAALSTALNLFRLVCWEVDQVLSEFAAALARAKTLLAGAVTAAQRAGLTIDERGAVLRPTAPVAAGSSHSGLFSTPVFVPSGPGTAGAVDAAVTVTAGQVARALELAASADGTAAGRLAEVTAGAAESDVPPPPAAALPSCGATPAEVRRWWDTLTPEQRRWLTATRPGWLGPLDGVPAGFRDLANRLLLDDRRTELDRAATDAHGRAARRIRELRRGLDRLTDRLADGDGPRAYLLRLDLAGEGRAVVALGDPDRAANVLTHVPGMTADLASYRGELSRAERVAVRAAELGPGSATSAVMWLDYDAPDFIDEAAGSGRAEAGAVALRRFQDGLRATHDGPPAHQTVLGHSYGSLVVGAAARGAGFQADSVVFVGSPGVGVDSAAQLSVPAGQVWSSTSRSDIIQYAAVAPRSLVQDVALAEFVPVAGPILAFGRPEDDLWFGRNPSDPAFGARQFASQAGGGHLGYWDVGGPALDGITAITLGRP